MIEILKCQYVKISNSYDFVILTLKFASFEETEEFVSIQLFWLVFQVIHHNVMGCPRDLDWFKLISLI